MTDQVPATDQVPVSEQLGRRERNKLEMRRRLATAAAQLFMERGYDAVSMSDVAAAAKVAEQTVYNYFPTKPQLVLDRADDFRERSRMAVLDRDPALTPAEALGVQVHEDIDRFTSRATSFARGEFPAQSVESETFRRYALEFREQQGDAIAEAIGVTDPTVNRLVARAHASALVTVIQAVTDRIGAAILSGADLTTVARDLHKDATIALTDAAESFRSTAARSRSSLH
ncbi:TetR/AcrR family transcriptional regulator [Frondihabitans cladoniiphilus]|uniref:TetR/AcrR family transcriptional regulator n=1 Tax=Frondihabitans cladoniiphilus TaxID=715785 RepID=A0ABP8VWQ9_9MICO